jgi:glutaredoxin
MPTDLPVPEILTVYGADWCRDCRNTKHYLDQRSITYRYVDLAHEPEAARRLADAGYGAIPVVVTPEGTIMIEPSWRDLDAVLGLLAA